MGLQSWGNMGYCQVGETWVLKVKGERERWILPQVASWGKFPEAKNAIMC